MSNIINTLEAKNIINSNNPIKNKALSTLLDFDMSDELVGVFNKTLYYCSKNNIQLLIEVNDGDIKGINIIDGNDKYILINDSENERVGINHEFNTHDFFITHFCSLRNSTDIQIFDYMDVIAENSNIFEISRKEKDNVKVLVK